MDPSHIQAVWKYFRCGGWL